jgi:hypothetical protein|eukprot:Transcript_18021.p1 GENE.Transcript_18021~~Transcript_18021.p1  ORF type:complete len:444 (-),score=142.63 Transcript_18021:558-1889(-)
MSVRDLPLRVKGGVRSLSEISNDADRDALLSEEKRWVVTAERRRKRHKEVQWTWRYSLCCTLGALVVGFCPLLMVAAYTSWLILTQGDDPQDDRCSYTPSVNRSTSKLLYRGGDFLALLTSADEGPRAEYRRMVRLSLSNKHAYATRHHYSLYVLDAARPECIRRAAGWYKLLALEEQVRLRTYEWLLWMDADTIIMDPAQQIGAHLLSAAAASGGQLSGGARLLSGAPSGAPGGAAAAAGAGAAAHHHAHAAPQQLHMIAMGHDGGLSAGMVLLPGRWAGSACLLKQVFGMRRCLPRDNAEAGAPAALLSLLQPPADAERARECARQSAPACMATMRLNYSVLSPRLFAPLAEYRHGDFAVHLAGCIGRREVNKPLRQCEAKLVAFANLSRSRGVAEGPAHAHVHAASDAPPPQHTHGHDADAPHDKPAHDKPAHGGGTPPH